MPEMVVAAVLVETPMAYEKVVAVVNPDGTPISTGPTTITSNDITDASTVGKAVLTAADAAAARAAIGAGTSSLTLGTTGTTAAAGNHTHAGLMTGTATNVPDSAAADVATLVTDFNNLLAALAARGVITNT